MYRTILREAESNAAVFRVNRNASNRLFIMIGEPVGIVWMAGVNEPQASC